MAKVDDTLSAFGRRLRSLRLDRNLTQEDLAHAAGFDRTYISLVERGKRNISLLNLLRFAEALEVDPRDLLIAWDDGEQP